MESYFFLLCLLCLYVFLHFDPAAGCTAQNTGHATDSTAASKTEQAASAASLAASRLLLLPVLHLLIGSIVVVVLSIALVLAGSGNLLARTVATVVLIHN
jgi:hypothetical protein